MVWQLEKPNSPPVVKGIIMFKEGTSTQQKIVGCAVFFCCGLFAYSLVSPALIFDHVSSVLLYLSLLLAIIIVALFTWFYSRGNSKIRQAWETQGHDVWTAIIIVPSAVIMISYAGIAIGLPTLLHDLTKQPSAITVSVKQTRSTHEGGGGRRSGTCNGKVYLADFNYMRSNFICGLVEEDWEKLKPGDRIELIGHKSLFGFDYSSYKILENLQ